MMSKIFLSTAVHEHSGKHEMNRVEVRVRSIELRSLFSESSLYVLSPKSQTSDVFLNCRALLILNVFWRWRILHKDQVTHSFIF